MKTFVFALVLSLICSGILAVVSQVCQPRYVQNKELERKVKTLSVLGFDVSMDTEAETINQIYEKNIEERDVTNETGEAIMTAYVYQEADTGAFQGVAFPVSGKGLWGPIRGMVSLAPSLEKFRGVRFFDHQETPGLGAEIEKAWFQEQFVDRPLLNEQGEIALQIVTPGTADGPYEIDGISGATITGNGVHALLKKDIRRFLDHYNGPGAR